MLIDELSALVTGRQRPLFADDFQTRREEIAAQISGKRLLVIGGAGSIGAATVRALVPFLPHALHVVDQNENALAELVRDLRSRSGGLAVRDFRAWPLDFGSPVMERLLAEQPHYDHVLNFAAIKHVRSEKDVYSLLQMLDTNLLKPARLMRWLAKLGGAASFFCVSTDKAANPVNLMGASKRLMEQLVFSAETAPGYAGRVASARFANVAFSEGSLLQGFLQRLAKRQPLAAPRDTRRYFVSLEEAGQICLLAATCAPSRHLLIPRLDPAKELRDLESIAAAVLRHHGWEPATYDDEQQARERIEADLARGCYPLLLTPLDTSGEKPYEEFIGTGEAAVELGMPNLLGIPWVPLPPGGIGRLLETIEQLVEHPDAPASKNGLAGALTAVLPDFHHVKSDRSLDQRM